MGNDSPRWTESLSSAPELTQYFKLENGSFTSVGHIIEYEEPKTWPAYMAPNHGSELAENNVDVLNYSVREYFPDAQLFFDNRGAVVTNGYWTFVACSKEAIDAVGSYALVFFLINLKRAKSLKLTSGMKNVP